MFLSLSIGVRHNDNTTNNDENDTNVLSYCNFMAKEAADEHYEKAVDMIKHIIM